MSCDSALMFRHGYRLCTWQIIYYLPDAPLVIAPPFMLQKLDLAPKFPELHRFLGFWKENIQATIHSVTVMSQENLRPTRMRMVDIEARLN